PAGAAPPATKRHVLPWLVGPRAAKLPAGIASNFAAAPELPPRPPAPDAPAIPLFQCGCCLWTSWLWSDNRAQAPILRNPRLGCRLSLEPQDRVSAAAVVLPDIVAGAIRTPDDRVDCHLDSVASRRPGVLFAQIGHRRRPLFCCPRPSGGRSGHQRRPAR